MSRQTDIQKLFTAYHRRLQKLKEQEALKGLDTPPQILIEIEDIEAKLDSLQAELQAEPVSSTLSARMTDDDIEQELTRMAQKEQPQSNSTQIGGFNISGVSGSTLNIGGNVSADVQAGGDIVGGDKTTHQAPVDPNSSQAQLDTALTQWRTELETIIAKLDDEDDKEYAEKTAAKVVDEAKKGQAADPAKIEGFLKRLGNMAPDIIEVTAKTLQNPFAGVGLVLEKINDRIKMERQK